MHFLVHESKTMRVAQRDLLRITSTMKLLESYYNGQKGEHNSRWQLVLNNRRDLEQIMGGKIGIMCGEQKDILIIVASIQEKRQEASNLVTLAL